MQFSEAQEKIKLITNEAEKEIAELLLNMGFTFIAANSIIENSSNQRVGEIDLLFSFEDYLLIVEVSKDRSSGNAKKITFFTKWSERTN